MQRRKPKVGQATAQTIAYEAERRDMVLAEINRELASDSPNWNYLERLKSEFEYWKKRTKNAQTSRYISFFSSSNILDLSDDDEN